jgi:RNA-directed DNA polymerase
MDDKQPSSIENLITKAKVKPEPMLSRADSSVTVPQTEQSMFNADVMEGICARDNLKLAYKKVCQNQGAPGVDNVTVEAFGAYLKAHWPKIKGQLLTGIYQPQPVKRVSIPKPHGRGVRHLGIPCVIDRFIQQAILQILQPTWDKKFSAHSYGFRPGKSAHQAISQAQSYVRAGYSVVVDIDLEQFFDRVNHDQLMSKLRREIKDTRLLKLLRSYLTAGVLSEGLVTTTTSGMAQGGPLSPFLSNIVLDDLDKELERRGHKYCRFADDSNVYVKSIRAGERVMKSLERFITERLKLQVNQSKSAVAPARQRSFLGFRIIRQPAYATRGISPQAKQKFKSRVRQLTRRNWSISLEERIKILSRYLRGWHAYFGHCETKSVFKGFDGWIRRRLRCAQWKQWKHYRCRKKNLIKLGISPEAAHRAAWASGGKGHWMLSDVPETRIAMSCDYFRKLGLVELHALSNIQPR